MDLTPIRNTRRTRAMIALLAIVLAACVLVLVPVVINQQYVAAYTEALNNTRAVRLALLEFDQEFGAFPDEQTRSQVEETTGVPLGPWTGSANDCFRQLVAFGIHNEDIFFAIHPEGSHQPDNAIEPIATQALQPGEVGLSYTYGLSSGSDPSTPLLLAPMKSGTLLAHPETYAGKAVVRLLDGSALPCSVTERGEILDPGGRPLLDPSRPCWQDRPIDIRDPEFPH